MRIKLIFCFLFIASSLQAQPKILTWNIENLGQSKSDSEINFIANTVKAYDIVALQEVVAGDGGAQAVAKLADELNRKGAQWDYVISDPTSSSAYKTERYAFLWKTAQIRLVNKPWLEKQYGLLIDREPYYATFEYQKKQFTLANFHAITQSKQPETEIKHFKNLPGQYPNLKIIFLGDFNCPQSHTVFNPLKKMGYQSAFEGQKTSLKKSCIAGDCLSKEFDNIWANQQHFRIKQPTALHFYKYFADFSQALKISDHLPLAIVLEFAY
jgi:endonuclease/exonuclease/phosphatase family metal-dependent hydrolase